MSGAVYFREFIMQKWLCEGMSLEEGKALREEMSLYLRKAKELS